uniref:Adenylate kinase n=1 Tax=Timema bartmani TaxID=61472 RepID=A0A7R9F7D3_9NEOP|nr:unnamed protein product [Timema bartmani]
MALYPELDRFLQFLKRATLCRIMEFIVLVTAPYLLKNVVSVLANQERKRYPIDSEIIDRGVYIDDVTGSFDTEVELHILLEKLMFYVRIRRSISKLTMSSMKKPAVVFVLGGPGAGKGTQCANIVKFAGSTSRDLYMVTLRVRTKQVLRE